MKKKSSKIIISKFLVLAMVLGLIVNFPISTYAADVPKSYVISIGTGLNEPSGLAVDNSGNVYMNDYDIIQKMDVNGHNIQTLATGLSGGGGGVAVASNGYIYATDFSNGLVKKISPDGLTVVTIASGLINPVGIALDSSGNIYVAERGISVIRKMDADGHNITTLGTGFGLPNFIALDSSGNIYVADTGNNAIKKMDSNGSNIVTLGTGFNGPWGVTVDSAGNIYVVDSGNKAIKKMDADGHNITTLATGIGYGMCAVADSGGYVYFSDYTGKLIGKIVGSAVTLDATHIELTMNNDLLGTEADKAAFLVHGAASNPTVTAAVVSGKKVTLTLSSDIAISDSNITVDYLKTGINNLANGTELANFAGLPVNNVLVPVTAVSAIPDINVANGTAQGAINLPQNVNITVNNSTISSAAVTWDNGNPDYNSGSAGTYVFTGTLALPQGVVNPSNKKASVNVIVQEAPDTQKPVITLTGNSKETVANGDTYNDAGATAADNKDGDVTGNIVKTITNAAGDTIGNIDTKTAGTYVIHYNVSDAAGNKAVEAVRTVVVLPADKTIQGNVIDYKSGSEIKGIEAKVISEADGTKTVDVKASDAIVFNQSNGSENAIGDLSKLVFNTTGSSNIKLLADGTIQVKGLASDTENKYEITYDLGNGQKINIGTIDVIVGSNGEVSLTCTLIDPYGVVTDSATGKIISGANITLYYANTDKNKAAGITPDTVVQLPIINGDKSNNANPQISDAAGAYGFLVYPNTDYYIVAKKEGYEDFKSETIAVANSIVRYDFQMTPKKTEAVAVELPKTGGFIDFSLLMFIGVLLIGIGFVVISTKKNKIIK